MIYAQEIALKPKFVATADHPWPPDHISIWWQSTRGIANGMIELPIAGLPESVIDSWKQFHHSLNTWLAERISE